jgi:tRNA pseudouridine55 synthase
VVAYKPQNWTSFDVVAKARGCLENDLRKSGHEFKRRSRLKVGHGGTLDPMAEGLLVLGIGTGCRGLEGYLKGGKAYRATARLGFETDTQDATGEVLSTAATAHVTISDLRAAAAGLVGTILQRPPIYSALRKDGKRLHELARAGKLQEEDVEPRQVHACHPCRFCSLAVS